MSLRFITALPLLLCSLLVFSPSIHAEDEKVFTVGIVPQQASTRLVRTWTPMLNYLSEKTGYKLQFKTATDISAFEGRLYTGEYDFAYMNPYHYVTFNKRSGYDAFARERGKSIQGIVVTHKDSEIKTINDLRGETLAFPSFSAFAASILPRAELARMGINIDARYVGSHDSVYHVIARKRYMAGGGILRTFNAVSPEIRKQLRILWTSEKYTPHAFAAHSRINKDVVKRLQESMIQLGDDPVSQQYLANLHLKGFIAAKDSDWRDIRQLGIDTLR